MVLERYNGPRRLCEHDDDDNDEVIKFSLVHLVYCVKNYCMPKELVMRALTRVQKKKLKLYVLQLKEVVQPKYN